MATNNAIDLAGGLTQVLADSQRTYLYGNGRIAQYRTGGVDYFLGDALGSVRQLVDGNGNVILAKNYEPYGELMDSTGSGETDYGFTNEFTSQGLIYLRARWYDPWQGRFISRDTWDGDYTRSLSLNKWIYVKANPINYQDPSGNYRIPCVLDAKGYLHGNSGWEDKHVIMRVNEAEKYVRRTADKMDTYAAAGIAIQCAGWDRIWDYNSGVGIAQVSQNQVEKGYGEPLYVYEVEGNEFGGLEVVQAEKNGKLEIRGYGLRKCGLHNILETPLDPNDPADAVILMKRRIQLVTNACVGCTDTDRYIAAALAQNGPGFTHVRMRKIGKTTSESMKKYNNPDVSREWFGFFEEDAGYGNNMVNTKTQLVWFDRVIKELLGRGWFVPPSVINSPIIEILKNWPELPEQQ
jgi:RHS repeat-associated protein